jgi:hypothetical protein
MTVAMFLEIVGLIIKLEPEGVKLFNSLIGLFQDKTPDEQQAILTQMKAALQPMQLKE